MRRMLLALALVVACGGPAPIESLTHDQMPTPVHTQIEQACGKDQACIDAAVAEEIEQAQAFGLETVEEYEEFVSDLYDS